MLVLFGGAKPSETTFVYHIIEKKPLFRGKKLNSEFLGFFSPQKIDSNYVKMQSGIYTGFETSSLLLLKRQDMRRKWNKSIGLNKNFTYFSL